MKLLFTLTLLTALLHISPAIVSAHPTTPCNSKQRAVVLSDKGAIDVDLDGFTA